MRISIDYGINLFNYEQITHEQERGAYLPPSIVLSKLDGDANDWSILPLSTLLTDQKRMDNTYVFSTLTLAFITFTLLYTGLAFWGLDNRYPL